MRMVDLIEKKRDGIELTQEEINFIIDGYTKGLIPDYQMSAFAMAVFFKDMTNAERAHLTMAMLNSGDKIDLSKIEGIKVDKHSTGGVGDKTTLVLTPLVAACGVPVAKMSGRGLGHTGGTLDKLEAVPHFNIDLTEEQFFKQVNDLKIAVIGQTANLTPADKKLYALRDVTATVDSIPLIASSIMSKKLASGADAICLDVKVGKGSFMKTIDDAKQLAKAMVEIGNSLNRNTVAFLTNMEEPLGFAVGNSLEVMEAIDTLKGNGPKDVVELCLEIGSYMLLLAKRVSTKEEGRALLVEKIENGEALNKLFELFIAQGAPSDISTTIYDLPKAKEVIPVIASIDGYVQSIDALSIGHAAMMLGAGRLTKEDQIDLAVGVVLSKKVGDQVSKGETLAFVHTNGTNTTQVIKEVERAYTLVTEHVEEPTLIYGIITE